MDAVVTVFVRHSADCKHRNKGEFYQACKCRKHLRWTFQGKQYRKTAGTRSWERALEAKRFMEAKVTGTPLKEKAPQSLANAVVVFLKDKQNQGITAKVIGKYTRELARLREFCESKSVFLVRDLTRELLRTTPPRGQMCIRLPSPAPKFANACDLSCVTAGRASG